MIKSQYEKGLKIEGDSLTIAAELSAIIHFMLVDNVLPKKDIEEAIRYAFMSDEEIETKVDNIKEHKNVEKEVKKELKKLLDELFD